MGDHGPLSFPRIKPDLRLVEAAGFKHEALNLLSLVKADFEGNQAIWFKNVAMRYEPSYGMIEFEA